MKKKIKKEYKTGETTKKQLIALQRIYEISPTPEAINNLLGEGLHSAYGIAEID